MPPETDKTKLLNIREFLAGEITKNEGGNQTIVAYLNSKIVDIEAQLRAIPEEAAEEVSTESTETTSENASENTSEVTAENTETVVEEVQPEQPQRPAFASPEAEQDYKDIRFLQKVDRDELARLEGTGVEFDFVRKAIQKRIDDADTTLIANYPEQVKFDAEHPAAE